MSVFVLGLFMGNFEDENQKNTRNEK